MARIPTPRLPGIVFEPRPAPRAPGLPPLDVAGFVGFARRGPLDLPVAVEDAAAFAAVFGGAQPLAHRGRGRVDARLPGSVAAFFANGGRRCQVVRVAGSGARAARFHLPGLVALSPDGARASQASLTASSPGRWGDALRLSVRVEALPLPRPQAIEAGSLVWHPSLAGEARPAPGETLRLSWADGRRMLLCIRQVEEVRADGAAWLLVGGTARRLLPPDGAIPTLSGAALVTPSGTEPLGLTTIRLVQEGGRRALEIAGADAGRAGPGDLVRLRLAGAGADVILAVRERRPTAEGAALVAAALLDPTPLPLPDGDPPHRAERLRLDLRAELPGEESGLVARLPSLAFGAEHPRFWGDLLLLGSSPGATPGTWSRDGLDAAREAAESWRVWFEEGEAVAGRAPPAAAALAGLLAPLPAAARALDFLPLGLPEIAPEHGVGPVEPGDDGLDCFEPRSFLDPVLVPDLNQQPRGESLRLAAEDRWLRQGRRLRGLHALTFVEEVALVAMPDASHAGWAPAEPAPPSPASPPPPEPDLSNFDACRPETPAPTPAAAPQPPATPDLPQLGEGDLGTLVALHAAMLRFCHARRDVVALLSLPEGSELAGALAWEQGLRATLASDGFGEGFDADGLSYAAAWLPWLLGADGVTLPPDGAVAGVIARRERQRGAWIAPANEPVAGVLDLAPAFDEEGWAALLGRRINLVRRMPRDFRAPTAHSLSAERRLLHISVRRLLILLRKLALRRGQELVFENNDERLREALRVNLDETLTHLFERGAFAGRTPDECFRVLNGPDVNPQAGLDRGELVTRILVAPSEPMEFLLVRLNRAETGALSAGGS